MDFHQKTESMVVSRQKYEQTKQLLVSLEIALEAKSMARLDTLSHLEEKLDDQVGQLAVVIIGNAQSKT